MITTHYAVVNKHSDSLLTSFAVTKYGEGGAKAQAVKALEDWLRAEPLADRDLVVTSVRLRSDSGWDYAK